MQEIIDKKEYITKMAEKFYFKDIKIYPDTEQNSLCFLVEYNIDTSGNSNLEIFLENYLRKDLGIIVSVIPISKLYSLHKENILSKSINYSEVDENLVEEKFACSIEEIKFKACHDEDIDEVSLEFAQKQISKYEEDTRLLTANAYGFRRSGQ